MAIHIRKVLVPSTEVRFCSSNFLLFLRASREAGLYGCLFYSMIVALPLCYQNQAIVQADMGWDAWCHFKSNLFSHMGMCSRISVEPGYQMEASQESFHFGTLHRDLVKLS